MIYFQKSGTAATEWFSKLDPEPVTCNGGWWTWHPLNTQEMETVTARISGLPVTLTGKRMEASWSRIGSEMRNGPNAGTSRPQYIT
ncbi:hypothetical protein N8Z76_00430 [Gammaproteobacteria bacterium]|nr:hypothetical protein [Gammaproteobacteria bacterium]